LWATDHGQPTGVTFLSPFWAGKVAQFLYHFLDDGIERDVKVFVENVTAESDRLEEVSNRAGRDPP
jgi:hypothetical protein